MEKHTYDRFNCTITIIDGVETYNNHVVSKAIRDPFGNRELQLVADKDVTYNGYYVADHYGTAPYLPDFNKYEIAEARNPYSVSESAGIS